MSPAVTLPTMIEVAAARETHTRSDSPAIFSFPPVVSPLLIRCVCLGKRLECLMLEWNGGFRLGVNGGCREKERLAHAGETLAGHLEGGFLRS